MMVSTKGRYALRVMVELAARGLEEFVPLKEIAEHQEISEKYLEAIMKSLVKEGLVTGLRGKGGGYRLSKPPAQYTVGSILKVTEGSLAPVACLGQNAAPLSPGGKVRHLSYVEKAEPVDRRLFRGDHPGAAGRRVPGAERRPLCDLTGSG